MMLNKVAILSPGAMGHAVGRVLAEHGVDIMTCLAGRSERTHRLASAAGFTEIPTLEDLVCEADLVLSILVPVDAEAIACQLAGALKATGAQPYIADCNAISPMRSAKIETIIQSAGGRFIDASIIGPPPGQGAPPRFYVSGIHAEVMLPLDGKGIVVKSLGDIVGRASGIKMCYAALTKGTSTLQVALLTAAESMGLTEELRQELAYSQATALQSMESTIPRLPPNAHRWVGEMEEIASTFAHVGVTSHFHLGAAAIYRLLEATSFANESPETIDPDRTLARTIEAAVAQLPRECESQLEEGAGSNTTAGERLK
jgi:3-hydroxyisobutyrate dehydrogenase-like beta-hydroxyacid dehydrogenase